MVSLALTGISVCAQSLRVVRPCLLATRGSSLRPDANGTGRGGPGAGAGWRWLPTARKRSGEATPCLSFPLPRQRGGGCRPPAGPRPVPPAPPAPISAGRAGAASPDPSPARPRRGGHPRLGHSLGRRAPASPPAAPQPSEAAQLPRGARGREGRGHRRGAAGSGAGGEPPPHGGPGRSRPRAGGGGGGRAGGGAAGWRVGVRGSPPLPFPSEPEHGEGASATPPAPPVPPAARRMIWKTLPLLCALLAAARLRAEEEPRSKSKICANVFCGAGRECAMTEKGEPTCLCIEQCKPHKRPVCGSNGKTYLNHCELHRDACLTGSKIQVDYDGHCKEKKSEKPAASPVVCYQSDRDELRRRVIQWLEAEIIPDGWFSKGSNYSEVLDKYFKSFDDGDSRLDSNEFLKFVEQNETAVNITTYMDQETNKLLRGLCVDALIELSDENADWKLSFNEFLKCLSPSFNPPEKKCALEDETYEDGAETQVECNRCVCACGNWVCTAMTCEGKNDKVPAQRQRPDQDLTEEELARYVQELQKHQETAEKTKRMSTKEM